MAMGSVKISTNSMTIHFFNTFIVASLDFHAFVKSGNGFSRFGQKQLWIL